MRVELRVEGISSSEMQEALDAIWRRATDEADVKAVLLAEGIDPASVPTAYAAKPGEEGFGAIELILIGAAARVVGVIPERLVGKLFDEVIWPRLQARFGDAVKRGKDAE